MVIKPIHSFYQHVVLPVMLLACVAWIGAASPAAGLDAASIPGLIVDDVDAELSGKWTKSTSVRPFWGESYIHASGGDNVFARFTVMVKQAGNYDVFVSYSAGSNRAAKVPVQIQTADGSETAFIDQQQRPQGFHSFHRIGSYRFEAGNTSITVSTENTNGVVIADGVALLTAEQVPLAIAAAGKPQSKTVAAAKSKDDAKTSVAPAFERESPSRPLKQLTSAELDKLLDDHIGSVADVPAADDATFLRRVSLDLIGRQPTLEELDSFVQDARDDKRAKVIDRLLASDEFGANWANYWSDVIRYRTPQPQLTFLNYQTFKDWLAGRFNSGADWDEIVHEILTATGKVGENPAATFIGFHQADTARLAGETTRIFLATQIQCAECHDHKFIDLPQETFHHFAAFFVRADANLPWNDSDEIEVKSKPKGEHKMPGGKGEMQPVAFDALKVDLGKDDMTRRAELAAWVVSPNTPWFAKAYVNRVWSRLMGRGFCEPVDEIGELADAVLPEVHEAVGEHFAATGYDIKGLMKLITSTRAYARTLAADVPSSEKPFAVAVTDKLRGDEVFSSLQTAIELENVTPPQAKANGDVRFPPPPKSTRDLVDEAFGYDPSVPRSSVVRSMKQAMLLMNNAQIQRQIDGRSGETVLSRLLDQESDDQEVIDLLFRRVLARSPNETEVKIVGEHIAAQPDRRVAFEDLLWSLLNTAEFVTRK